LAWDSAPKKYFWVRDQNGNEVLQGNYEAGWLRPFMHGLTGEERASLRFVVPYANHCSRGDGHHFRIERERDVEAVTGILKNRYSGHSP
jgi:hypothetical protein